MAETWKKTACILCSVNCGIEVRLEERRLVRIRGDRAHPTSAGYTCEKAQQQRIEPYVVTALLGRRVGHWLRAAGYFDDPDNIKRLVAKRGGFHLGRVAAYLWRGDDKWTDGDSVKPPIEALEGSTVDFAKHFENALQMLVDIISADKFFADDVDRALKSSLLDQAIDKKLYTT